MRLRTVSLIVLLTLPSAACSSGLVIEKEPVATLSDSHDDSIGLGLANMCELSYLSNWSSSDTQAKVKLKLLEYGFTKPHFAEHGASRFIAASHEDTLIICFRGTDNLTNWWRDISSSLVHDKYDSEKVDGKVHSGFQTSLDDVWFEVRGLVATRKPSLVLLGGHSLGGAMAILAARRIERMNSDIDIAVYTYGQPMVGNEEFRERFEDAGISLYRYIQEKDPVVNLPEVKVTSTKTDYRHFGEIYIVNDPESGVVHAVKAGQHQLDSYIRAIKNKIDG